MSKKAIYSEDLLIATYPNNIYCNEVQKLFSKKYLYQYIYTNKIYNSYPAGRPVEVMARRKIISHVKSEFTKNGLSIEMDKEPYLYKKDILCGLVDGVSKHGNSKIIVKIYEGNSSSGIIKHVKYHKSIPLSEIKRVQALMFVSEASVCKVYVYNKTTGEYTSYNFKEDLRDQEIIVDRCKKFMKDFVEKKVKPNYKELYNARDNQHIKELLWEYYMNLESMRDLKERDEHVRRAIKEFVKINGNCLVEVENQETGNLMVFRVTNFLRTKTRFDVSKLREHLSEKKIDSCRLQPQESLKIELED